MNELYLLAQLAEAVRAALPLEPTAIVAVSPQTTETAGPEQVSTKPTAIATEAQAQPAFSPSQAASNVLLPLQKLPVVLSSLPQPEPVLMGTMPQMSPISTGLVDNLAYFAGPRPSSGSQLYHQRRAALQAGQLYTRLAPDSFQAQWINAQAQPTYEQWQQLLAQEAKAVGQGQGQNRLTVMLGDSLSLWLPPEWLPRHQFWLNQGISGDTTAGILNRLSALDNTRPTTIHLMAGINDLRHGASNQTVLTNLSAIVQELQQRHPQAEIVIYSILPTRLPQLPSDRIADLNQQIQTMTAQTGVNFLNLQPHFADNQGGLRPDLTTDGLHLNLSGYRLWHHAIAQI
jgi:lysophospholipase L1-like esterase